MNPSSMMSDEHAGNIWASYRSMMQELRNRSMPESELQVLINLSVILFGEQADDVIRIQVVTLGDRIVLTPEEVDAIELSLKMSADENSMFYQFWLQQLTVAQSS